MDELTILTKNNITLGRAGKI